MVGCGGKPAGFRFCEPTKKSEVVEPATVFAALTDGVYCAGEPWVP
jgi:hypothetical protein